MVKQRHDLVEFDLAVNIQHDWLRPLLRPYQVRGVKWMLQKEQFGSQEEINTTGTGTRSKAPSAGN